MYEARLIFTQFTTLVRKHYPSEFMVIVFQLDILLAGFMSEWASLFQRRDKNVIRRVSVTCHSHAGFKCHKSVMSNQFCFYFGLPIDWWFPIRTRSHLSKPVWEEWRQSLLGGKHTRLHTQTHRDLKCDYTWDEPDNVCFQKCDKFETCKPVSTKWFSPFLQPAMPFIPDLKGAVGR